MYAESYYSQPLLKGHLTIKYNKKQIIQFTKACHVWHFSRFIQSNNDSCSLHGVYVNLTQILTTANTHPGLDIACKIQWMTHRNYIITTVKFNFNVSLPIHSKCHYSRFKILLVSFLSPLQMDGNPTIQFLLMATGCSKTLKLKDRVVVRTYIIYLSHLIQMFLQVSHIVNTLHFLVFCNI